MSGRRLLIALVAALSVLLLGILFVLPRIEEARAPSPRAAWVGVEVAGSGIAEVGTVEIDAGTDFRLHAILEVELSDGSIAYMTEAREIRFAEGTGPTREVPAEQIRPYELNRIVRPIWLTIEGSSPFLQLESEADLERFVFRDYSHPEWGRLTSVDGELDSEFDALLDNKAARDFGRQRFQVWIELFDREGSVIPAERMKSPGPEDVLELGDAFPGVIASLPGGAGPASTVFGLTQLEPPLDASEELHRRLTELTYGGFAFSRLPLVGLLVASTGLTPAELDWRAVELNAQTPWTAEPRREGSPAAVAAGDLLQVGSRFVVLYRDEGVAQRLDPADLCFDFVQGASIRELGEVFVGEGEIDWARLSASSTREATP